MVVCKQCELEKEEKDFPVLTKDDAGNPLTFRKLCKVCYASKRSNNTAYKDKQNAKDRHERMLKRLASEETQGLRTCKDCNVQKLLNSDNFAEVKTIIDQKEYLNYRRDCRDCNNKSRRENEKYKKVQGEKRRTPEYRKKSRELKRTEEYKSVARKREKFKYDNDIIFRLKKSLRSRTRQAMIRAKFTKRQGLIEYLGCTPEFFATHMENQFESWMNWNNYDMEEGQLSIDHIIPLDSATSSEELHKLCHYTNCRPLLHKDNMIKSNKKEEV